MVVNGFGNGGVNGRGGEWFSFRHPGGTWTIPEGAGPSN